MKRSYKNAFACAAVLACGLSTSVFATEPNETEFTVQVNPYLNVTLSDGTLSLPITPTSNGTFGSTSFTALASTNHIYGYKLNVSFKDSTNTSNTDLVSNVINVNTNAHPTIPTFTTDDVLTSNAFSTSTNANHLNHWAISYGDDLHYKKAEDGTIATSNGPVIDDDTDIYLGTKLDLLTSPGSYSTTMIFEVVGNPAPSTPDNNPINQAMGDAGKTPETVDGKPYYKMQDMTASICNSITTPTAADYSDTPEAQLVDIRDGKLYWVAKLKDGNCWMTQNLDLNLDSSKTYTNSDTDLGWNGTTYTNASWQPERSTISADQVDVNGYITGWQHDYDNPYSFDAGNWYWVGTWYSSTENDFTTGQEGNKFQSGSPFGTNGKHGHVGNYYNYAAAIASNDASSYTSSTYDDPELSPQNSICPRNWRLPSASSVSNYNNFYKLIDTYNAYTSKDDKIIDNPMYFVRAGFIDSDRDLRNAGYEGFYRASTVYDDDESYALDFYSDWMSPGYHRDRGEGWSVRCVAR